MPITTLIDELEIPNRTQEQKVFDNLCAGVFQKFPKWGREVNETLAAMNALLAGGAYAFPFTLDTGTADSDPGSGRLRFNVTGGSSPTVIRMDDLTSAGTNISSLFSSIGANGSSVKGAIRIVAAMDPTKFALFDITGVSTNTGYRNISVAPRGAALASTFAGITDVLIFVDRVGDAGPGGSLFQAYQPLIISAPASSIDYLNSFTTVFDKYIIELQGIKVSAAAALFVQLCVGGVVVSAGYTPFTAGGVTNTGAPQASASLTPSGQVSASNGGGNFTIEVLNINDTTSGKTIFARGSAGSESTYSVLLCGASHLFNNGRISGFRVAAQGANIVGGTVRIFGVRNAV